jgi:glutathione S-transferase
MRIELFGRPYNRTDRVQWTLEELAVQYEYRKLDVFELEHRGAEFRDLYGLTRLPFVRLDGEVLFESGAIMLALGEHFRSKVDLLPEPDTAEHRDVLQWLFFANSTLDAADASLQSNAEPAPFAPLVDVLNFLEETLAERAFIAASKFTLADIALSNNLKYIDGDFSGYRHIARYFDEQTSRPAYQRIVAQVEYKGNR